MSNTEEFEPTEEPIEALSDEGHDGEPGAGDTEQPAARTVEELSRLPLGDLTTEEHRELAKSRRWKAPEEWKGKPPAHFVADPAEYNRTFEEHGDPRLVAQNRRALMELEETRKTVDELKAFTDSQRKTEEARIQAAIRQAIEDGDYQRYEKLEEQKAALTPSQPAQEKPAYNPDADENFHTWRTENGWYNTDPALTQYANSIAAETGLNPQAHGKAFYDAVSARVRKDFPERFRQGEKAANMSGERQGQGQSAPAPKSKWGQLPDDVRQSALNSRVFKSGTLKNDKEGREHYASIWLSENGA